MAQINKIRQVDMVRQSNIADLLPQDLEFNNFAVFCGQSEQRTALAAHAISRYVGRIGIVLIHNEGALGDQLQHLAAVSGNPELVIRADRNTIYDPLYGMSADSIVNLLVPKDPLNPLQQGVNTLRSGLLAYLEIMEYQFSQARGPFGNYPYNLNLLLQLTEMSIEQLERRVLQYMPQQTAHPLLHRINGAGIQQDVYSCVMSFASTMREYLWNRQDFRDHSCISIIDAMAKRQIICLRVPYSHGPLLNYFDAELQVLSNRNTPFLLINCGVDISSHPGMQKWFLDAYAERGYYTALVADSITPVTSDANQRAKLFSRYQQMFVFPCSAVEQAEPFSAQFGSYYREIREHHQQRGREPFHVFSSHHTGVTFRQVEERNIRPEELTGLRDGLLLCGSAYDRPILINTFHMTGGNFDGALLP